MACKPLNRIRYWMSVDVFGISPQAARNEQVSGSSPLVGSTLPRPARREGTGHALDAVDEVRAQHLGRAGDFEIREPSEQLAEHDRPLSIDSVE
jgi:hypothetical protein